MNSRTPRWHDGLLLAQLLTLLLLGLSYLRIAGDSQSAAFRDDVLNAVFAGRIWGTALSYNLIYFALCVLLVHCAYGVAVWMMGRISAYAWPSSATSLRQHVLLWFVVLTLGVLANNAAIFTASSLGEPYSGAMTVALFGIPIGRLIWLLVVATALFTFSIAALRWWKSGGRPVRRDFLVLGAAAIACLALGAHSFLRNSPAAGHDHPNVILIGLDSLRADLLEEQVSPKVTPNLEAFVKGGTRFSNAMTPLARTFSSLSAMFTGRSPHHTGAVMNLLPRDLVDDSESLPRILGRVGYHTAYATDEVRFANIDTSYGFAQTITPPIGASEFMIEKFADTPVTNLIINTRLGSWLFPHVYANRGISVTYDPDSFVARIDRELEARQPLFLTAHLTLDHWPYAWAGAPTKTGDAEARWPPYYLNAAQRADQQLGDILEVLRKKGLLDNALVVVYSDHGESFDAPDQWLMPKDDPLIHSLELEPQWGHGTSVLSAHQYRIVLGVRRFGESWPRERDVAVPVSFEDIAPTIVEYLGVPTSSKFDGRSLLPVLKAADGAELAFKGRIRFTETEFQPATGFATQDGKLSPSKIVEALAVYSVDRETDRILIKKSLLANLMYERQYAAIGEHHLICAFPNRDAPGFLFLTVPLAGGTPRQLFAPPGVEDGELHTLWEALQGEFGSIFRARPAPVATPGVANRKRTVPSSVTK